MIPRTAVEAAQQALAELRQQVQMLDDEIARVAHNLTDLRAQSQAAEDRAMTAVRAGDDRAAKAALMEQYERTERAAALETDLEGLRALASECRRVLEVGDQLPGALAANPDVSDGPAQEG
jgi:phage shock protein A